MRTPFPTALPFVAEPLEERRLMSVVTAIAAPNQLIHFNDFTPDVILAKAKVKGLQKKEALLAIDYRPSNSKLYALGSTSRIYTIDPASGQATQVGAGPLSTPLSGTEFGFDFSAPFDRIRIVSDADQNMWVNADTGEIIDFDGATPGVQADAALSYAVGDVNFGANPAVVGAAYNGNFAGAGATAATLFAIDSDLNALVRQGSVGGDPDSPNNGRLTTIGALAEEGATVDVTAVAGFDIQTVAGSDFPDTGFVALSTSPKKRSALFTVLLETGAITRIGDIGRSKRPVRDIAFVPDKSYVAFVDKKNTLYAVNSALPSVIVEKRKIVGFGRGERVTALDIRPADSNALAVTNKGRLYRVDLFELQALLGPDPVVPLAGKVFAADVDPVADQLRVLSDTGQNIRFAGLEGDVIDADTVAPGVQADAPLVYAAGDVNAGATPRVVGLGYTNAVAAPPPTTTTAFVIDASRDVLATLGSADGTTVNPNTGQLFTVGPLGVDADDLLGFDLIPSGTGEVALASFKPAGARQVQLFSINLVTGAATLLGNLGTKNQAAQGMSIISA